METEAAKPSALERTWWLRAPAVLVAPRAVFASLRDDADDSAEARQEPLVALAALAGIAAVLPSPTFRRMLNDGSVSLAGGSSASVLDEGALAIVRSASPFPPFPAGLNRKPMNFRQKMNFELR